MNKNIKRIIACTLAIGTFLAAGPTKYVSFFTTAAHASSSDADELTDIQLENSSGNSIKLYTDSSYDDKLDDDPEVGETYYAKTSASKINLDIDGADEDDVRIFKNDTAYEVGDNISISSGSTTTLKVRVYEDAYDDDEDYSSSDYNQYTIKIKNTDSDSEDDDVNLSNIVLSKGSISFDKDTTSYNVDVDSDVSSIDVQANPEDDDYTVKIDGTEVSEDDDYAKTVSLSTGSNTVLVKVLDDDDNTKTYTLNINRPEKKVTQQNNNGVDSGIPNKMNNGITPVNNANNAFNEVNNLVKGWKNDNGIWYYFEDNGNKATGWKQVDGTWYYLDTDGKMKTGWVKDTNGKWYYLQASGAMAKSTMVDGYRLGADGSWIN